MMTNTAQWMRRCGIRRRLIIALLVSSLLPLMALNFYSLSRYASSIEHKISASTAQTLALINTNFITEIEKYQYLCGSICINETVQNAMLRRDMDTPEKNRVLRDIQSIVKTKLIYPAQAKNITIYYADGSVFYDLGYDGLYAGASDQILEHVKQIAPDDSLSYVRTYSARDIITLARRVLHGYSDTVLGYTVVWIDEKLFSKTVLEPIEVVPNAEILLMRSDGMVLSAWNDDTPLGQLYGDGELARQITALAPSKSGFFELTLLGERRLVNYNYDRNTDLYFVYIQPFSYINSEYNRISRQVTCIAAGLALLCVAAASALYASISRPVAHMVDFCKRVAAGDLSVRLKDAGRDELAYLSGRMDAMAGEISDLLSARERDEEKKRELQIRMLNYQINPHFLFNTLNSLRFVADMNQDGTVSAGLMALSNLLNSALVDRHEYIPLRDEMQNLRDYFAIQSIRFAGMFSIAYELDEALLDCLAPKLLLQPLAENALMHGRRTDGSVLHLRVSVLSSGDNVLLRMEDDGCGFDPDNAPPTGRGIGIANISDRMKLSFGEPYGLTIHSEAGKGTVCEMLLPVLRLSDEEGEA